MAPLPFSRTPSVSAGGNGAGTTFHEGPVAIVKHEEPDNNLGSEAPISTITETARRIIELSISPAEANLVLRNITNNLFLLEFYRLPPGSQGGPSSRGNPGDQPDQPKARMILIQLENRHQVLG